jgi:hypothetical protein
MEKGIQSDIGPKRMELSPVREQADELLNRRAVEVVEELREGMLGQDRSGKGLEGLEVNRDQVGEGIFQVRRRSPMLKGETVAFDEADDTFMSSGDTTRSCFPLIVTFSWDGLVMGVDATTEVGTTFYEEQARRAGWMGWMGRSRLRRPFMG